MKIAKKLRTLNAPSFKQTLIIYFSIFIVVPMILIVSTFYNVFASNNLRNFRTNLTSNLNSVQASTLQFFDQINNIAKTLLSSSQVQSMFASSAEKSALSSGVIVNLNSLLQNYSVVAYNETVPLTPYIYLINNPEYYKYQSSNVRNIQEISNKNWFCNLPTYFDYKVINTEGNNLLFIKRLYNQNSGFLSLEGVLTIEIGRVYYENLLARYQTDELACLALFDSDNSLIAQVGEPLISENDLADLLSNDTIPSLKQINGSMLGGVIISEFNWKALYSYSLSAMNLPLYNLTNMIFPLLCVLLITAILLADLLSDHIAQPIKYLVASMKNVKKPSDFQPIIYRRRDEFQYLIMQYNKMVTRLDDLIIKLHQTEKRKKEAEMASLQAQINPHFLYNTLDSITMLAMWEKYDDIIEVVTALSNFFRYSLSKGKSIISISDEIKQLTSYLKIQKLRFDDTLDYEINIDHSIYAFKTVKLILQPLVENSIVHGIAPTGRHGKITINGTLCNGDITFVISDNGMGYPADELNKMLVNEGEENKSYGIRNVNWRIQNYFGENYGICYSLNTDGGISCTVRIRAL